MSDSKSTNTDSSQDWRSLVREQLVDYGRMLALGNELLEVLQTYPGPAKLKDLSGRRGNILRSLQQSAEQMEREGLLIPGSADGILPQKTRGELRRALEAVLDVEERCRRLHEEHLDRLRRGIQELEDARDVARVYGHGGTSKRGSKKAGINITG